MKLKEFSIIRYGPLENLNKIKLNDFNLIWGGKKRMWENPHN